MPVEKRTTPTVQKSIDFILTGIAEKRFEEEMILPTVADLARLAGVSKTKMVDAVGVLKSRGILSSTPGHRLRVKSDARRSTAPAIQPPAPPVGSAGPRTDLKLWQRIESRMKTDLLNGRFEDETPLPSHKDLQRTYDATYAVMRKALASLEEKGFIVSARRGYMPRPLPARTSLARIVFIIPGLPASGELYLFDNVDNVLFHAVETACANAGVRLDILAIPLTGDGAIGFMEVDTGKPLALTDTAETLGYLYSVEMAEVKHEDVLSRLRHFGKPVAVFSTLDDWTLPRILRQSPYFKLFTMTAPAQAAAQMARYLLRLGHRSIAYVSPHQRYAWSTARLEGLQSVYASAGHEARVDAYCSHSYGQLSDFIRRSRQRREYTDLKSFVGRWEAMAREEYVHEIKPVMQNLLLYAFIDAEAYVEAKPLFRQALDTTKCTAWVLANDVVAVMAKSFLKSQGVRVPGDISLVGFDDSIPAMKHRITSYDFNVPAVARAMVGHIVNYGWFRKHYRQQLVEICGHVVERDSVRRRPESRQSIR